MKITTIKQQVRRTGRYSIFVDGKYGFSLSDTVLLESRLVNGQELTAAQVKAYKRLSDDDKLYNQTLCYVALRPRSHWEVQVYLERKQAAADLRATILDKLHDIGLLDDAKFAETFVRDRRLLRPTSRRKLTLELRQKHLSADIIQAALGDEPEAETEALQAIITQKRRQTRYQDDLKLMQYLARQGFSYGDIKEALQSTDAIRSGPKSRSDMIE